MDSDVLPYTSHGPHGHLTDNSALRHTTVESALWAHAPHALHTSVLFIFLSLPPLAHSLLLLCTFALTPPPSLLYSSDRSLTITPIHTHTRTRTHTHTHTSPSVCLHPPTLPFRLLLHSYSHSPTHSHSPTCLLRRSPLCLLLPSASLTFV